MKQALGVQSRAWSCEVWFANNPYQMYATSCNNSNIHVRYFLTWIPLLLQNLYKCNLLFLLECWILDFRFQIDCFKLAQFPLCVNIRENWIHESRHSSSVIHADASSMIVLILLHYPRITIHALCHWQCNPPELCCFRSATLIPWS